MIHLVYCNDKAKVLEKILAGTKAMIVRGATGRKFRTALYARTVDKIKNK